MRGAPTRAGRLARAQGILAACGFVACGGAPATQDAGATEAPAACQQLATAYYAIARNKDHGSTKERQLMLVRQVAFEDPSASVESLAFLEHVVEVVYRYPDEDAEAIRQRIVADCEIDADGEPVLRTFWTQP
jgi:hypothetical protein